VTRTGIAVGSVAGWFARCRHNEVRMLCDTAEHVLLTARYLSYGCKGQQITLFCDTL